MGFLQQSKDRLLQGFSPAQTARVLDLPLLSKEASSLCDLS